MWHVCKTYGGQYYLIYTYMYFKYCSFRITLVDPSYNGSVILFPSPMCLAYLSIDQLVNTGVNIQKLCIDIAQSETHMTFVSIHRFCKHFPQ